MSDTEELVEENTTDPSEPRTPATIDRNPSLRSQPSRSEPRGSPDTSKSSSSKEDRTSFGDQTPKKSSVEPASDSDYRDVKDEDQQNQDVEDIYRSLEEDNSITPVATSSTEPKGHGISTSEAKETSEATHQRENPVSDEGNSEIPVSHIPVTPVSAERRMSSDSRRFSHASRESRKSSTSDTQNEKAAESGTEAPTAAEDTPTSADEGRRSSVSRRLSLTGDETRTSRADVERTSSSVGRQSFLAEKRKSSVIKTDPETPVKDNGEVQTDIEKKISTGSRRSTLLKDNRASTSERRRSVASVEGSEKPVTEENMTPLEVDIKSSSLSRQSSAVESQRQSIISEKRMSTVSGTRKSNALVDRNQTPIESSMSPPEAESRRLPQTRRSTQAADDQRQSVVTGKRMSTTSEKRSTLLVQESEPPPMQENKVQTEDDLNMPSQSRQSFQAADDQRQSMVSEKRNSNLIASTDTERDMSLDTHEDLWLPELEKPRSQSSLMGMPITDAARSSTAASSETKETVSSDEDDPIITSTKEEDDTSFSESPRQGRSLTSQASKADGREEYEKPEKSRVNSIFAEDETHLSGAPSSRLPATESERGLSEKSRGASKVTVSPGEMRAKTTTTSPGSDNGESERRVSFSKGRQSEIPFEEKLRVAENGVSESPRENDESEIPNTQPRKESRRKSRKSLKQRTASLGNGGEEMSELAMKSLTNKDSRISKHGPFPVLLLANGPVLLVRNDGDENGTLDDEPGKNRSRHGQETGNGSPGLGGGEDKSEITNQSARNGSDKVGTRSMPNTWARKGSKSENTSSDSNGGILMTVLAPFSEIGIVPFFFASLFFLSLCMCVIPNLRGLPVGGGDTQQFSSLPRYAGKNGRYSSNAYPESASLSEEEYIERHRPWEILLNTKLFPRPDTANLDNGCGKGNSCPQQDSKSNREHRHSGP